MKYKWIAFFVLTISPIVIFSCEERPTVVCIHGFFGSEWNMLYFRKHLLKDGWNVVNWGYPSRSATIKTHSEKLVLDLQQISQDHPGEPISFVAHSMGSLVLRAALNHHACPNEAQMGQIVLLAPPNQGSSYARMIAKLSLGRILLKEYAGLELSSKLDFDHLGEFPKTANVLVISGDSGWNPFLKGKNDGTLSLEETRLNSPHVSKEISTGHKTILISKKALFLAQEFLKEI